VTRQRWRFDGSIAGIGSSSGVRVVVGHWRDTHLGSFADAMVETASGQRVLLAPSEEVAEFITATYTFDHVRIEPFAVTSSDRTWQVRSPSLHLDVEIGGTTLIGRLLRLVPRPLAQAPAWCAAVDPVARLVLRGVRTRGETDDRREWYGARDHRRITSMTGSYDGDDLGALARVEPPARFGFSSTPRAPSVTTVTTTVQLK